MLVSSLIWVCFVSVACISVFAYTLLNSPPILGICDAAAFARVWLDENGNGVEDTTEPPFAGACLWVNSNYPELDVDLYNDPVCGDIFDFSDEEGNWGSLMFSCYADPVFVSIKPPAGYKTSTIPVVLSTGQDIKFGVVPELVQVSSDIKDPEYYVERFRNESAAESGRNRFLLVSFVLASIITSWLLARRLVRSQ